MKTRKLKINSFLSILLQAVTIICGFLIPRAIMAAYGSEINGLVTSITQFLSIIGLLDLGIGAVMQAAYYKPLAFGDSRTTSLIFYDSKKFFRRIAYVLVVYVVIVMFVIWSLNSSNFTFFYISTLVAALALNSFAQYFLSIPYSLLLNSDQKYYITAGLQIILTIANVVATLLLIHGGADIQIVKLVSSAIFLIQPLILVLYVIKKYPELHKIKGEKYHLDQKWNGVAQHIATVIMNNVDVVVLTIFSNLVLVSIYGVTSMVINGIKSFVSSLSNSYIPFFGDLYAKQDTINLRKQFDHFEWIIHTVSVIFCSLTGILILSFIRNYTRNITDADYIQPLFSILMVVGLFIYCIRIPYNCIVCGAGHFRQTQTSAIIEAVLNIIISIALVFSLGLVGVAIGTLVAISYRTIYFVYYLNKNIIGREVFPFIKNIIIDIVECALIVAVGFVFIYVFQPSESYLKWIITALCTGAVSLLIVLLTNIIFYKEYVTGIFRSIFKKTKGLNRV